MARGLAGWIPYVLVLAVGVGIAEATKGVVPDVTRVDIVEGQRRVVRISLAEPTTEEVVVRFTTGDPLWVLISPTEMVFPAGQWDRVEDLQINTNNDFSETQNKTTTITCTGVISNEPYYRNWDPAGFEIDVTVVEDDAATMRISNVLFEVNEDGSKDGGFLISLSQPPTTDVTAVVTLEPKGAAAVNPARLVFNPGLYTGEVKIMGIDNDVADGDRTFNVGVDLAQRLDGDGRAFYSGMTDTVAFAMFDDDIAGLTVLQNRENITLVTSEADTGTVSKINVRLDTRPTQPVTVFFSIDDSGVGEGEVWKSSVEILADDEWNAYRESGVLALDDGDAVAPLYDAFDGDKSYTVSVQTASNDRKYDDFREKVRVTNRDNDGFRKLRFRINATRGDETGPNVRPGAYDALDLNELRLRTRAMLPVDLSEATAVCFVSDTLEDCPAREACALSNSCDVQYAIDENLSREWRTTGRVTMELRFNSPQTVCSHALVWGSGTAFANPYEWELLGWWDGSGDVWTRFYTQVDPPPASGPRQATPFYNMCTGPTGSLEAQGTFKDPPKGGYTDAPPPTPAPVPSNSSDSSSNSGSGDESGSGSGSSSSEGSGSSSSSGAGDDGDDSLLVLLTVMIAVLMAVCALCLVGYYRTTKGKKRLQEPEERERGSFGEDSYEKSGVLPPSPPPPAMAAAAAPVSAEPPPPPQYMEFEAYVSPDPELSYVELEQPLSPSQLSPRAMPSHSPGGGLMGGVLASAAAPATGRGQPLGHGPGSAATSTFSPTGSGVHPGPMPPPHRGPPSQRRLPSQVAGSGVMSPFSQSSMSLNGSPRMMRMRPF